MKGWVLHSVGDLRFEELPMPVPQPGEELVKVRCAGVCSSDIPRIFSSGTYSFPLVPGHEFSGETESGRRVAVFPLLPCFSCESCALKIYETCSSYSYIGSRTSGAFAEYVAVPAFNLIDIPEGVSFIEAALFEPAAVALHAANKLDLDYVECAAVVGDGVIGRLIAKWLALSGVADVALLGCGDVASNNSRYDACFEAVGSVDALRRCIDLVRPNGQLVLVGNPNAEFNVERTLYWQLLRKQIRVFGTWNSRYPDDWLKIIQHADKLELESLVSCRAPFHEAGKTLELMREKKLKNGKTMLMFN